MKGIKELKYSILILLAALLFTSSISLSLYWLFNIHPFPPKFGLDIWIILILVLLIPAYFIEIKLIKNFKLSKKREGVIILSSLFCIVMINFSMMDFMKNNYQTTKIISSVDEIYNSKSPKLIIKNFEIINNPVIYKNIRINKRSGSQYLQLYFLYPFKSEQNKNKVYYSLQFEILSDTKFFTEEEQMENFLTEKKKELQNYDFYRIKKFTYLTITDPNFDCYNKAVSNYSDIFLTPIANENDENQNSNIKFIVGVFLFYIIIFLLTRVEEWK